MLSGFLALSSCVSNDENETEPENQNDNQEESEELVYGPLNPKYVSISTNDGSVSVDKIGSTVYYQDEDESEGLLRSGSGEIKTDGEVSVIDCSGEFETAYVEFEKVSNAESYNVYLKD